MCCDLSSSVLYVLVQVFYSFTSQSYLSTFLTCSYGFQVDAVALQYQNQKLVQQLEAQKAETLVLENKYKEMRDMQSSYDLAMISINKMWNQVLTRKQSEFVWCLMPLSNISESVLREPMQHYVKYLCT